MSGEGKGNGNGQGPGPAPARWLDDASAPGAQALRRAMDEAPLDDDAAFAKQRVWNRVQMPWAGEPEVAPRAARGRGWLIPSLALAGVALAATGALVGPRLFPGAPVALAPGASSRPQVVPMPLPPPATIALTTGPDEHARHQLARGVAVELASRSALIPGDDSTAPEVKVGRVRFSVPHQGPGRRYAVRAGSYQVVVLGTTFDVSVEETGVGVAVATGVVVVEDSASGRQLAKLQPGMRWSSRAGDPHATAPAAAADEPRARRRTTRPLRAGPRPALAVALKDPVAARALDDASLARGADPRAAIARYQAVIDGGGPLAENALYEMGLIQAEDLRDPAAALATWERQRTRYPAGNLRAESDLSIFELLARGGQHARAFDEARAFFRRHPGSERRAEVARVAGDLARTKGDCRTAIGFYDLGATLRPDLPDVDDAAFHRAACLRALGDDKAAAAARDYLTRFPFGRHAVDAQRLLAGGKVDPGGQ